MEGKRAFHAKKHARGRRVFIERVFSLRALCIPFYPRTTFLHYTFPQKFTVVVSNFIVMTYTDQVGNNVTTYNGTPERIISLVPSQTELLADLGLERQVVGITKFCIYPPSWRKTKPIVGGTKNFHFDTIHSLKPDLIIGNKEENYQEGIVTLQ